MASFAADIIDKPIGLLYSEKFGKHTRLAAHTLIACVIVFVIARLYKKRFPNSYWYAFAYCTHHVLDRMWIPPYSNVIFLWPLLGSVQPHTLRATERWARGFHEPYTIIGEIIGLMTWAYLINYYRLYKKSEFMKFIKTGRLSR